MRCGYCGRLTHRCQCHQPGSRLAQFMDRGWLSCQKLTRSQPFKRGVPPQLKSRERRRLRANHSAWYQQLTEAYGESCANCASCEALVLDHVIPIAKGGRSRLDNLQLLCAECNRIKGKLAIDCRPPGRSPEPDSLS